MPLLLIALLTLLFTGCAHEAPPAGEAAAGQMLYIPPPPGVVGGRLRTLFVEPLAISAKWQVSAAQRTTLQAVLVRALAVTVADDTVFEVVSARDTADMLLEADLTGIQQGAVTARLVLRNASNGNILIRSLETRATQGIPDLRAVAGSERALDLLFQSWGESLRRGLLELQGPVRPGGASPGGSA